MPSYYYYDTHIFAVDKFKEIRHLATEEFCSNCGVNFCTIRIGDKTYSVQDAVYEGTGEEHGTWLPQLTQYDLASYFRNEPTSHLQFALQEANLTDFQIRDFYIISVDSVGQAISRIVVERCSASGCSGKALDAKDCESFQNKEIEEIIKSLI